MIAHVVAQARTSESWDESRMLKYEAAVTLLQSSTRTEVLFGTIESASLNDPWYPFDQRVINFLNDLSRWIISSQSARSYPELIAFGFWCRISNITSLQQRQVRNDLEIGRGVSFHIPPSNVPLNCAYSLAVGLLAGNTCIVRLPAASPELDELLRSLGDLQRQQNHDSVMRRLVLLRYGHNDQITTELSGLADVRVIWGGDSTVQHIRTLPTKPRCVDIAFADRVSVALIRSESVLECSEAELQGVCARFVADSLTFGQNACSSPRLVVWEGSKARLTSSASSRLWGKVDEVIRETTAQEPIEVMSRLAELCEVIATSDVVREINAAGPQTVRLQVSSENGWLESSKLRFGTFSEISVSNLDEVTDLLTEKVQTLTYFGYSTTEIRSWLTERVLAHVDHVVPIGNALDFDLIWDGFPMIQMMTRSVRLR